MTVSGFNMINTLDQVKQQSKAFTWDVVTVPVDPKTPNESSDFGIGEVFAINAQSKAQKSAWELVKYINSGDLAKIQANTTLNLLSRTSYMKEKSGHSLEAFYKLNQIKNIPNTQNEPPNFFQTFNQLVANEIQPVLDGKTSLDDALQSLQNKGQQALDQASAAANIKKVTEKNKAKGS